MVDTKTVEILAKAKALVENKWVRCAYYERGAYCAIGALEMASNQPHMMRGRDSINNPLYAILMKAKSKLHPKDDDNPYIQAWNDYPKRTQQEVVCLFQKAIDMVIDDG